MIQEHQMTMNKLLVTFFGRKVIRHTIITGFYGKYMFKARTGKVYVPNIVFVLDTFKTVKVNCVLRIILAVKWEITHKINKTHIF